MNTTNTSQTNHSNPTNPEIVTQNHDPMNTNLKANQKHSTSHTKCVNQNPAKTIICNFSKSTAASSSSNQKDLKSWCIKPLREIDRLKSLMKSMLSTQVRGNTMTYHPICSIQMTDPKSPQNQAKSAKRPPKHPNRPTKSWKSSWISRYSKLRCLWTFSSSFLRPSRVMFIRICNLRPNFNRRTTITNPGSLWWPSLRSNPPIKSKHWNSSNTFTVKWKRLIHSSPRRSRLTKRGIRRWRRRWGSCRRSISRWPRAT